MTIFGNKPRLPEVSPPAPIEDEVKLKKAREKEITKKRQSTGRMSTILSED